MEKPDVDHIEGLSPLFLLNKNLLRTITLNCRTITEFILSEVLSARAGTPVALNTIFT